LIFIGSKRSIQDQIKTKKDLFLLTFKNIS
jgi:hypothetical protein